MAASVECRSFATVMKEVNDDVEFSLNLWSCENKTSQNFLPDPNDFGDQYGSIQKNSFTQGIASTLLERKNSSDDFLRSESDKQDYEWLLTASGNPIFPSLETEIEKIATSEIAISGSHLAVPESELANSPAEPVPSKNEASDQPGLSTGSNTSMAANKRPSSTGGLKSAASRSATPTGRSTLPAKTKPSRASTPTSRATLPTTAKPRASTPTSRAIQPTLKPSVRSSTPTRPVSLSSTPTSRPSLPALAASKPTSRSTTPTSKNRVTKSGARNMKTSLPERPVSASKARPVAPTARSSSRGRVSNGIAYVNGIRVVAMSREDSTCKDDVSPVIMGTKMVERVVNMRKLAPPKLDGYMSRNNNSSEKSASSQEKSGFGRTLSRSSLDMALRHMDIRRSIPGKLRPLVTNIPDSSTSSLGSGSSKSGTTWDSPLATSSNASSEPSFNNSSNSLDEREVEDTSLGNEVVHSNT